MKGATKICSKCKSEKDHSLFFKHTQTKDGLHSWCKNCCSDGNKKSLLKTNSTIHGRARIFLQNAKKSAQKRKQEFTLEIEDIVSFWEQQHQICAYSGRKMTLQANQLNTVSIERIDSNKGYTQENTILVCQAINRMKSDFSLEDFYALCADTAKFIGNENLQIEVGAYK